MIKWIIISISALSITAIALLIFTNNQTENDTQTNTPSLNQLSTIEPTAIPTSISPVTVDEPKANILVSSPLKITGSAPGYWFFEAQMTARLETSDGKEIAFGPLTAEGEWMTEQQVPFSGTIEFKPPTGASEINLIIEKANPSDLAENAQSYTIPLKLTP